MGFLWPIYLLLLIAIPAIIFAYVLVLRRRKRFAVRYSSLSLIQQAMPGGLRWRRHLPFALMVIALVLLILSLSRPWANVTVASNRTTVMLALDVSLSMCATDIAPNRLAVASGAAQNFIENQIDETRIGVVAFAGIAELIVPPTRDKELLLDAVGNLQAARATAVGSAIARSLDALAEVNPDIPSVNVYVDPNERSSDLELDPEYQPDVIVLLTDGASTRGVSAIAVAEAAADRGVRVYTIGFGTPQGAGLMCSVDQLGNDQLANQIGRGGGGFFGGGGFGGGFGPGNPIALDEYTLQGVADITGGEYYVAESADELLEVFSDIPTHIVVQKVRMEVSAFLTAISGLLALLALVLGMRWSPLP